MGGVIERVLKDINKVRSDKQAVSLEISAHVDDLDILVIADTRVQALDTMVLAATLLGHAVVNQLEMTIAISKAAIISSDEGLACQAAQRIGKLGGASRQERSGG